MRRREQRNPVIPRPYILGLIIAAGFILLGVRLFHLQIVEGEKYQRLSDANRVSRVAIPAPRGRILDGHGKVLANNTLQSSVFYIVSGDEGKDSLNIAKLATYLDIPLDRVDEIQSMAYQAEPETVVPVKSDLPKSVVIELEERKDQFPRVIIETEAGRSYPYGRYATHVIGYLGLMSPGEYEQKKHLGYSPNDIIGKYGIENMYDSILRGTPGVKKLLVDVTGKILGVKMRPAIDTNGEEVLDEEGRPVFEEDRERAEAGDDIELTLDIDLQSAIVPLLRDRHGAVVAMDPNDGSILGIVSSPTFDPNLFGGRLASGDWQALVNNPGHPLQNRSIQNSYPPGSVFKPVTAWAALEAGKVNANSAVNCDGVFELGERKFRCWKTYGHGRVDFIPAMAYSCDEYFYYAGYETGATKIAQAAQLFGFGLPTGIDLPGEVEGRIPDSDWKLAHIGERWYGGDTVNMSIGQGYIQTTPLQIARMTAIIANGGKLVTPHLLKIYKEANPEPIGISDSHLSLIRQGMRGAVTYQNGTAHALYSLPFTIAAKTGTAQDPPREWPHSWLMAYAPYENPQIVLVAFLENVPAEEPTALSLAYEILNLPEVQVYVN
jgi:penicillin-binding protein 2